MNVYVVSASGYKDRYSESLELSSVLSWTGELSLPSKRFRLRTALSGRAKFTISLSWGNICIKITQD